MGRARKRHSVINCEQLAVEIQKQLKEYTEDIRENVWETAINVSGKAVKKLKAGSPKRTGKYAKNWTRSTDNFGVVIHEKGEEYRLTHLLEKGHQLMSGGRKVGEVQAKPHIAKIEEECVKEYLEETERIVRG